MVTKSIEAQVVNGRLEHQERLDAFEGQRVHVTVVAATSTGTKPNGSARPGDDVALDGLDLQRDIYVKMPFEGEVLRNARIVEAVNLKPCIIVPEELPDG